MQQLRTQFFIKTISLKLKLVFKAALPATKHILFRTYSNVLNFGLGRRINFSAIKKVHVPTTGARVFLNIFGGFVISMGATMVMLADLGATTTDVLLTGLSKSTGISIASSSFAFLGFLFVIMIFIRSRIGIGTILVPLSVSSTFTFSFLLIPQPHSLSAQLLYFLIGLFVIATGVGIGASAGIGMGAYESLCSRMSELFGWHPQMVRLVWECIVLVAGISAGGAFGPGTIIAAFATGWILQYMNVAIGDYLLGRRIRTNCERPLARGYSYDR